MALLARSFLVLVGCLGGAVADRPHHGLCPPGCECWAETRGPHGCKLEVVCHTKSSSYPTEYHPDTDCITIENPGLSGLDQEHKIAMFQAMPPGLKWLDLSTCGLGAYGGLPAGTFGRFPRLRFLNLEFNRLVSLPADLFHGAVALRTLWLTGNHWEPHEEGYALRQKLGNRIKALHPNQFFGLAWLRALLIHHNKIKALPAGLFQDSPRLRVVKLVDNLLGSDEQVIISKAVRPLVEGSVPRCARGRPSVGECLQLDVEEDSGDALEDLWDEAGVSIAEDSVVDEVMDEARRGGGRPRGDDDESDEEDGDREDL